MPSASKSTTLYASGGYPYTLSSSFVEIQTSNANNTGTMSCTAQLIPINNYWSSSYSSTLAIYWHDNRENVDRLVNSITFNGIAANETKTVTGTITVYHKEDGTLSGYAYAYFTKGSTTSAYAPNSGGVATDLTQLTTIDRYPIIITANNFTDEENPTITYTTNVGFENATTYACISLDGTIDDIAYRQVNINDGTYTFNLTTTERDILRNATPNNNELNVYFVLKTVVGTDNYYSSIQRKMTIVNANPTYTHTEIETVQKVIDVLGTSSANSVIQNASIMRVTIVPTALKGASISSVRIASGLEYAETKTTSPYVFDIPIVSTGSFTMRITDSRGNTRVNAFSKTLINYTPVSLGQFTFERDNPTSSDIIVNFEGNYLQTTFGSTTNVPTIKWKLEDGVYTTIPNTEYTIDTTNNKISISNYELTNVLNYKSKGTFTIELSDLLTSASDSQDVLQGVPTFDYGERDFQVNGDLFIADEDGENKVNVLEEINRIKPKFALGFVGTITQFFTNWQQTPIKISEIYTNDSNMFTLDTSNGHNRIVIGSGVSLVEVSGLVSWNNNPTNGEFDATIMLNGNRIRMANVTLAHVFNSQNTVGSLNHNTLPIIPVEVQEGDYFEICSGGAVNDNVTIMEATLYIKRLA